MAKRRPKVRVYDSLYDQEFPEHRRYAIAYEPIWQSIRHKLHWADYDDARMSLARVDGYVAAADEDEQLRRRVWRVFNLLCAIPHGQSTQIGIRIIERNATTILVPALDRYRERLTAVGYPTVWDWNWSRTNAQKMWQAAPDDLIEVHKKLHRERGSKYRRWHSKPEFWYYLDIIEEVMNNG